MIDICPPEYQTMARYVISSLAEKKAKAEGRIFIENTDMVNAFMEGVPGPFQADMHAGLKKYGLLPGSDASNSGNPPPSAKKMGKKVVKKAAKKSAKKIGKKIALKS